eukprot:573797-Prymnesium_polylepis.6
MNILTCGGVYVGVVSGRSSAQGGHVRWAREVGARGGRVRWAREVGACGGRVRWAREVGACGGRVRWARHLEDVLGHHPVLGCLADERNAALLIRVESLASEEGGEGV